jgi:hypothetical protein
MDSQEQDERIEEDAVLTAILNADTPESVRYAQRLQQRFTQRYGMNRRLLQAGEMLAMVASSFDLPIDPVENTPILPVALPSVK